MTKLLLGIDLGTASSKAVVTTFDGDIVCSETVPHEFLMPRPGWAEVDAEAVWWADIISLAQSIVAQIDKNDLAAMSISGVGPCLLVCDENNIPLRPAILYGIDMRATNEINELTQRYGATEIINRGGTALSTQAVGPKMLWVSRNEPSVWEKTRRWFNSNSYIVARLTDEYVLDHHTASQCDPLYDIHNFDWYQPWVDDLCPTLTMPRLLWPSEIAGSVTREAALLTGLPEGLPVSVGTVDAWAEAFSAGVRKTGDLMLMYGSTMFMVQGLPELSTSPMLWTTAGVLPNTYTFAAGMATSGSLTAWMSTLFGGESFENLVKEAERSVPGSHGLLLLPYFAGERTPVFDPQARGVIAGLSLRHTRGDLFRSVYEGIAFGIRQILEIFDGSGAGPTQRIFAVGGGTRSGLWTQIVSDVTQRTQIIPEQTIGASYGDAWLAGVGIGAVDPTSDWSKPSKIIQPDDSASEIYDKLFETYKDLYASTQSQVHILAQIQEDEVKQ